MTCTCGRELSDAAKFCGGCGARMTPPAQKLEFNREIQPPVVVTQSLKNKLSEMETILVLPHMLGAEPMPMPPTPAAIPPRPKMAPPSVPPPSMPPPRNAVPAMPSSPPPSTPAMMHRPQIVRPPAASAAPSPSSPFAKMAFVGAAGLAVLGGAFLFLHFTGSGSNGDDDHGLFFSMESGSNGVTMKAITETGAVVYSATVDPKNPKASADQWDPLLENLYEAPTWGIAFRNKSKKMIIDRFGKKTIDPPAIPKNDFVEGLAITQPDPKTGLCGYLDRNHKLAVPMEFSKCDPFSGGFAAVAKDGKSGYVNRSGKLQIPLQYETACPLSEGLAKVQTSDGWSFINEQGKLILKSESGECHQFHNGVVWFRRGSDYGLMDRAGKEVLPPKYRNGTPIASGRAFAGKEGAVVLIDTTGKEIPIPKLEQAGPFVKGLSIVKADGKFGLMDTQGRFVTKPIYDSIDDPTSGLRKTHIKSTDVVGFLDERGKEVKPPAEFCLSYNHGVFNCVHVEPGKKAQMGNLFMGMMMGGLTQTDLFTRSGVRIGGLRLTPEGKR